MTLSAIKFALNKKIGKRSQLTNGEGIRFQFPHDEPGCENKNGFAIEFSGKIFAFENRCPHLGVELDWVPGVYFDEEQAYLVCSTHGARFEPDTGECVSGPCVGQSLAAVAIVEEKGELRILETGL